MIANILLLISSLIITIISSYVGILGLTSIFSTPSHLWVIIVIAMSLDLAKVSTVIWLHNYWKNFNLFLKSYMVLAVIVLMALNSMSLFGFLSKANVEQVALAEEQQAQIHRIDQEIVEQKDIIAQAKQRISNLGTDSTVGDAAINSRISDANKVIDLTIKRIQPQIDEQQHIISQERDKIEQRAKIVQIQIDDLDKQVASLDGIIKGLADQGKIRQAQIKQTQQRLERTRIDRQKTQLIKQINDMRIAPNAIIDSANIEIAKLHARADDDAKQAKDSISKMTAQLGQPIDVSKVQLDADQQNLRIKAASDQLNQLTITKFNIESETRKLEVEVGPIKYIAQMFYGDEVDQKLLSHAVRWVILTLIFVFDPLAVLMLIAANQGLAHHRRNVLQKNNDTLIDNQIHEPEVIVEPEVIIDNQELEIEPLTTAPQPATVYYNESAEEVEPDTIEDNLNKINDHELSNDIISEITSNVNIAGSNSLGLVSSTEDLLTTLQNAHSTRLSKISTKLNNNQER